MTSVGNILLLSNDLGLYDEISSILSISRVVRQSYNLAEMIAYMHKFNPTAVIIDLDDYSYSVFKSIALSETDNYIPVLALYSKDRAGIRPADAPMEYHMKKSDIRKSLYGIIKIFTDFKKKYTDIKRCYNINDFINSETDFLLKKFIENESYYFNSIEHLLERVFINEKLPVNTPQHVLVASWSLEGNELNLYTFSNGEMTKDKYIAGIIDPNELFGTKREFENAFFMNCDGQEKLDLFINGRLFDQRLKYILGKVSNYAGYITTDTAILGANYEENVTQYDSGIIKELCINYNLIQNIYRQVNKVNSAFIYTVNALSRASEVNDDGTGVHIKRVNEYSRLIAQSMGLDSKYLETIGFSAQMHDVGKLSVPKDILTKPGKLTQDEFDIMKSHTLLGAKIIGDSNQLVMASEIAISHHEKFDGSGYPYRKAGEDIPLSGRIVAIADVYDALRTKRSYKPAYEHSTAYDIITKGDGRVMPQHFDPEILDIFKKRQWDFCDIFEEID
ncbi:MAG: HD-GYP domain-containing protein [Pseudomonadota bacterium]